MSEDIVSRLDSSYAFFGDPLDRQARDEIVLLRAALEKIMQKCPYARRDKWCACVDCNCIIARTALGEEKTDD